MQAKVTAKHQQINISRKIIYSTNNYCLPSARSIRYPALKELTDHWENILGQNYSAAK